MRTYWNSSVDPSAPLLLIPRFRLFLLLLYVLCLPVLLFSSLGCTATAGDHAVGGARSDAEERADSERVAGFISRAPTFDRKDGFELLGSKLLDGLDADLAGVTIAVLPFAHMPGGNLSRVSQYVAGSIPIGLRRAGGKGLKLFTRQYVEQVLSELERSRGEVFDEAQAPKLGKLLGVSHVAVGEIWQAGRLLGVKGQLIAVESGQIVGAAELRIELDSEDLLFVHGPAVRRGEQIPGASGIFASKEMAADADVAEWTEDAWRCLEAGDHDAAKSLFRRVTDADPKNSNGWAGLGLVAWETGDHDGAVRSYDAAIELASPVSAPYYTMGRARAWSEKGDPDRAIADYTAAIEVLVTRGEDPLGSLAEAHWLRAGQWSLKGRTDRAIEDYTAVIRLRPADWETYVLRAGEWLKKGRGRADDAVADLTTAIRLAPGQSKPLELRGQLFDALGEVERAVEDVTAAIGLEPNNAELYYQRGTILKDAGDALRAREDFAKAAALGHEGARATLGRITE